MARGMVNVSSGKMIGQQIITPSTVNQTITKGVHDGTGYVEGDADLVSANIKAGANIFGVAGSANVVDTSAGDAVAADMLSGKKAYVDGALVTGTIPSKGAQTYTPGTTNQTITAGQYLSGTQTIAGDADLVSANIKAGANIFGVAGNSNVVDTSPGTAVAGDLLATKVAFVDGVQITGTMVDRGTVNITPSTSNQTIAAGKHSGSGVVYGDADLVAANIKKNVNIFGVTGDKLEFGTGDTVHYSRLGFPKPPVKWIQQRTGGYLSKMFIPPVNGGVFAWDFTSNRLYRFDYADGSEVWNITNGYDGRYVYYSTGDYMYTITSGGLFAWTRYSTGSSNGSTIQISNVKGLEYDGAYGLFGGASGAIKRYTTSGSQAWDSTAGSSDIQDVAFDNVSKSLFFCNYSNIYSVNYLSGAVISSTFKVISQCGGGSFLNIAELGGYLFTFNGSVIYKFDMSGTQIATYNIAGTEMYTDKVYLYIKSSTISACFNSSLALIDSVSSAGTMYNPFDMDYTHTLSSYYVTGEKRIVTIE